MLKGRTAVFRAKQKRVRLFSMQKEDFIIEELYKMYLESEYQGDTRDDDEVFDFIKNYCIKYFLAVD